MTRTARLLCALAFAAAAIPGTARAQTQEPKDNKYTKEATKQMTIASLRQKPEEKASFYQLALTALQQGMQAEPTNAKVWLLAGELYAATGEFAKADSALKKAQEIYPGYAQEIEGAREQAWLKEFQKGTQALDRSQSDSAAAFMQAAETIYDQRPEAQLNLGVIYLNANKPAESAQAFKLAKARLKGPLLAKLKPEDQAQWKSWDQLIDVTMAQVEGNTGIGAFQKEQFEDAAAAFGRAFAMNPNSRDYVYNLAESYFAQTNKLENARRDAESAKPVKTAEIKKLDAELVPLYDKLIEAAQKVPAFDPGNTDSYIMVARAYRGKSLAATDAKEKAALQAKAVEALNAAQKLPFEVVELAAKFGDTSSLAGKIKNHTLKAGDAAKLRVTFLALDGTVLGTADVSATAGAADSMVAFEGSAPTKGQVAGWKYEIVK